MSFLRIIWRIFFTACALFGAGVLLFFILHAKGTFNAEGTIDPASSSYAETLQFEEREAEERLDQEKIPQQSDTTQPWAKLCKMLYIHEEFPETAEAIFTIYNSFPNSELSSQMLYALSIRHPELKEVYHNCELGKKNTSEDILEEERLGASTEKRTEGMGPAYAWMQSEEWQHLSHMLSQDRETILQVASRIDISPRLLVVPIIGEQLRFYTSQRSTFKQYLKPAQKFMYLSKFSYGIAGMKPATAEHIEKTLKNPLSPFYLGKDYENLLDYPEDMDPLDIDAARLLRIDNKDDRSWVYLYVGLYLKQFEAQWEKASHPIGGRPDILATLYNLGHNRSLPKENPDAGGAKIILDGQEYSFGGLAYDFYWSGAMLDVFPY